MVEYAVLRVGGVRHGADRGRSERGNSTAPCLAASAGSHQTPEPSLDGRGRVRVLLVITRLNVGGPAAHAVLLAERMDPARYETRLVTGTEDADEGNYLALHGKSRERVLVLPDLGRPIRPAADFRAVVRLARLIRRFRPHIVHTHTAKAGALGRAAALLAGVSAPALVHTFHGHVFRGYFTAARARAFLTVERWLAGRTDRLLAVSPTVRRELLSLGIGRPERMTVMPLGLDLAPFLHADVARGRFRAELGVPEATPLVGIVARLVPIKAHEVFVAGARALAARVRSACFVVVGDGERRSELEALARGAGLTDRIRFVGWRRDLDRVYADLDVVVLTSRNEGSPVALIEAMAAGRAVVATRVGGVPDLVEDRVTGSLVPPDDAGALALAIEALLADPSRRARLGAAARQRVHPAYGAERLLADMDRLYTDVLRVKGAAGVV